MPTWLMVWPGNPALSALILLVAAVLVLYGARTSGHKGIRALADAIDRGCALTAGALRSVRERVRERTREVLLSEGLEDAERQMDQEFRRISAAVERDLGAYPVLHRKLSDQVARLDDDYRRVTDSPPEPEAWSHTIVAARALVENAGDHTTTAKAVDALRVTIEEAHEDAMDAYRDMSRERHELLARMVPAWRSMASTLDRVERAVANIFERSEHLDDLMDDYREIASASDAAERTLTSSTLTRFAIASLVLLVASLGGFVNFQLIALPMSEMLGATSRLGWMQTSDVAALAIILMEITVGLFFMESLRVTRLFPVLGRMDARARRRMALATFGILFILAGAEASLAYMGDTLAADRTALSQPLAGAPAEPGELTWISSVGPVVLGFILPFTLTFVAIPLESFIRSGRIVLGQVTAGLLGLLAFGVEMTGFVAKHLGTVMETLYDVLVFLPLKVEELVFRARAERASSGSSEVATDHSTSTA